MGSPSVRHAGALQPSGSGLSGGIPGLVNNPSVPSAPKLHYIHGMSITPVVVALLLAQAPAPAPEKKADPNEPVSLKGCVVRDSASGSSYTFTDESNGTKYRLAGKSVAKYSGMSVQVVGLVDNRKVAVTGGLWPTPNVAAQAGNMDPGKAAVIALGAGSTGTGRVELPTLRITRVGLGASECKP
jgi:hypothetical protein